MKKGFFFGFFIVFSVLILLVLNLFFLRAFSERQLDDLTPGIPCDKDLILKSDRIFVIPKFDNINISENMSWCAEVLNYGKKLELHGVYHTYHEFDTLRDWNYIDSGAKEFEKCFGFYPTGFKAPQMALSSENRKLLEENGFKIYSLFNQITHKVYHCDDTGKFSNSLIDLF